MDIEEFKKFARNKIEADALTQQVRDVIKTTKWQKQDMREGFKETFKPLIKSQDSIKKSIDDQQNATIAQLKANQLALTSGLEKINETNLRLAEMTELPALEGDYEEAAPSTSRPRTPTRYNIEKNLDNVDLGVLKDMGYPRPNDFFDTSPERLREIRDEVKNDVKVTTGQIAGLKRKKQKTEDEKMEIEFIQMQKDLLHKYKNILELYLGSLEYKMGQGMIYYNNPHQLLNRLELLGGSILAGNNGVIPEFSQIAHLLNQMKVISNKQLNDLLKTFI
ncbi:hypothetical protein ABFA07_014774 [Porites harrisoni]